MSTEHGRRGDRAAERVLVVGAGIVSRPLEQRVADLEQIVGVLLGLEAEAPSLDQQSRRFVERIRGREQKS